MSGTDERRPQSSKGSRGQVVGDTSTHEAPLRLWGMLNTRHQMIREVVGLLIATTSLAFVLDVLFTDFAPLWYYIAGFSPFLACYGSSFILVRRGRFRAAALLATGGTVVAQVGVSYYAQGQEAQALVSFVNLVLIAGFVIGSAAAVATCSVAVASVVTYYYLDAQGQLPSSEVLTGPVADSIALGATIITTGGLVIIAIRHVQASLTQERQASERATSALAALETATFDADLRAHLTERLVTIGGQLIETGDPRQLAHRLCEAVCSALRVPRAWVVGRGGAILGGAAMTPQGEQAALDEVGGFPVSLVAGHPGQQFPPELCAEVAAWTSLDGVEESSVVSVPGTTDVFLVVVGEAGTCVHEAPRAFLSAAAGLLGSGLVRTSAEEKLQQSQRMDAVGRLSAGLAHDFNNLLTAIMAGIDLVKKRLDRELDVGPQVQAIEAATERAANLTQRLMAFTAAKARTPEPVDLTALVAGMMNMLERTIEERITLVADLPDAPLWIRADPVEVERSVMNLVINARDAIADGGHVHVSVGRALETMVDSETPQDAAILTVEDDGEGMSAEVERRIFEPFFTTRGAHGGHGLGLSAVYGLTKLAGGRVVVRSRPGEGARFDVILPLVTPPVASSVGLRLIAEPPPESVRIMVVEDSVEVRTLICDVLNDAGYELVVAVDGQDALRLFDAGESVAVVVSDVVMPRLGGVELTRELRRRHPGLPVVLMSGYAPDEPSVEGVRRLHKPFAIDDLLEVISAALADAPGSAHQNAG